MKPSILIRKVEADNVDYYEEIYTGKINDISKKLHMAENKPYVGILNRRTFKK